MRGLPIPRYPICAWDCRQACPARVVDQAATADLVQRRHRGAAGLVGAAGRAQAQAAGQHGLPHQFHVYSRHYGIGWLHKPVVAYLRRFHNQAHCTHGSHRLCGRARGAGLRAAAGGRARRRHAAFRPGPAAARRCEPPGGGARREVVLSVGRIAPEKNLELLWRSFEAMRQVQSCAASGRRRRRAGPGGPAAALPRRGAGRFAQRGGSGGSLRQRRHLPVPSLTETYGNVTPEALASGLAVLATTTAAAELIRQWRQTVCWRRPAMPILRAARRGPGGMPSWRSGCAAAPGESTRSLDWMRICSQVESIWQHLVEQQLLVRGRDQVRSSREPEHQARPCLLASSRPNPVMSGMMSRPARSSSA